MRFKNTKLKSLCVRAILLIHSALGPHQPLLVSIVLVIGNRQPLLGVGVLGISKHGVIVIVQDDVIEESWRVMRREAR